MTTCGPHSNTATPVGASVYRELRVYGWVQGVGFRPFVHRLLSVWGWPARIANVQGSVLIQIGLPDSASETRLRTALQEQAPAAARVGRIDSCAWQPDAAFPGSGVHIVPEQQIPSSRSQTGESPLYSLAWQDRAICAQCCNELFDPHHRLYQYPFISCCDCGPRYSAMTGIPFDRERTSYHEFPLCDSCEQSYQNPEDRRFHAQTLACPTCGPALWLVEAQQARDSSHTVPWQRPPQPDGLQRILERLATLLSSGGVLAIKGLSGFHLCCDAALPSAIARIRRIKQRPAKPLAVMASREDIATLADCTPAEWAWLTSPQAPIELVKQRPETALPTGVTDGLRRVGLMLPYTGLHALLMAHYGRPLIMTSANLSGERLIIDNQAVWTALSQQVDGVVFHDRAIAHGLDDSVVQLVEERLQVIRSARGFAVSSLPLQGAGSIARSDVTNDAPRVLALGAEHKNAFCLAHQGQAMASPYAGSLSSLSVLQAQQRQLADWQAWFGWSHDVVVRDAHPDDVTFRLLSHAESTRTLTAQHHHAHFAAVLLEHHSVVGDTACFGLICDGHGWGEDGSVWGGELFYGNAYHYQRLGHLRQFSLAGGDQAARQPWRNAVALLMDAQLWDRAVTAGVPLLSRVDTAAITWMRKAVSRGQPRTTSTGRLFDAVYALITGDDQAQSYEGQAAMHLQDMAESAPECQYSQWLPAGMSDHLDWHLMLDALLKGMEQGTPAQQLALQFHLWLAASCAAWLHHHHCQQARRLNTTPARTVVLSGGVFQNALLLTHLRRLLTEAGWTVLSGERIPVNDEGIALGQAAICLARTAG